MSSRATVIAVTSLSLDPPSLIACINRSTLLHDIILMGRHFCVNVLRRDQAELSTAFSGAMAPEARFGLGFWLTSAADGMSYLADAQVTVTEVRIGPDLKHAIAFVARLGRSDVDALLPALKRATPFLRGQVAHSLRLKFAPDLTFQPDTALEYATKIDRLLHAPDVARDLGKQD